MEPDIFVLMACVGLFPMLFIIGNFILMALTFMIYKRDKGKLNFWQFAKRWKM